MREIKETIRKIGEPYMVVSINELKRPHEIVMKLVKVLSEDPRIDFSELARQLGISSVRKRYFALERKGMIKVIPKVNFSKVGILMFSVFSSLDERIDEVLKEYEILSVKDGKKSLYLGIALDMDTAARLASLLRTINKDVIFSLKHDYEIYNWIKNNILV